MAELDGLRVAILVDNGFEQVELTQPKQALDDAGAEAKMLALFGQARTQVARAGSGHPGAHPSA